MTMTTNYTPYQLASMADCASPDSSESPGAQWLELVASSVEDYEWSGTDEDQDTIHELADQIVPVYTYERWQVFADLAAWQEDVSEFGPVEDLTQAAGIALYMIAERLVAAILEDRAEDEDEAEDEDS